MHDKLKMSIASLLKLQQKDLMLWLDDRSFENKHSIDTYLMSLKKIWSDKDKNTLLSINPDSFDASNPILLDALLLQIDSEIGKALSKTLYKNISTGTIKGLFSYFGSDVLSFASGGVSSYVTTSVSEYIGDMVGSFLPTMLIEDRVSEVTEKPMDFLEELLSRGTQDILDKQDFKIDEELYLSQSSKKALETLVAEFENVDSLASLVDVGVALLMAISIDAQKLIVVTNPQDLDPISLAIISKYFAISKSLDESRRLGASFVYIFQDEFTEKHANYKTINEQKTFLQRYAKLELVGVRHPFMAVSSSAFVGRSAELQKLKDVFRDATDTKSTKESFISGSAGIGKTTLYKKHLSSIDDPTVIKLSIYNDTSKSNRGLASIKSSIEQELKRLNTMYLESESFFGKKFDEYREAIEQKDYTKVPIIGEWLEISQSITNSLRRKANKDKHRFGMFSQARKEKSSKEEQFESIYFMLSSLQRLRDKLPSKVVNSPTSPIVLLVDDLHWIDEDSAEFIEEYLLKRDINFHIIYTVRGEDAKHKLGSVKTDPSFKHTASLLKRVVLESIRLYGFDDMLTKEVIVSSIDSKGGLDKAYLLAKEIVRFVAEDKSAYATTLYVIEAINILCDENFYKRHKAKKLVEVVDSKARFVENLDIKEFEHELKSSLEHLKESFRESFSYEGEFILSTHAILEERLELIKEYYGEGVGESIVSTMILSGLVGSPFDMELVESIKRKIADDENELLLPINNSLKSLETITNIHYETVEKTYELIKREMDSLSRYSHTHQMLELFLDSKLEKILDRCYEESEEKNRAKEYFYEVVYSEVASLDWGSAEMKHQDELNYDEWSRKNYNLWLKNKILKKLFHMNGHKWGSHYSDNLESLARLYKAENNLIEANFLEEKALDIYRDLYCRYGTNLEEYVRNLNNVAYTYSHLAKTDLAIKLHLRILELLDADKNIDEQIYLYYLILSKINLAHCYKIIGKNTDNILDSHLVECARKLFVIDKSDTNIELYIGILNNYAMHIYEDNFSRAIILLSEAKSILEDILRNKRVLTLYILTLNNLSYIYYKSNNIKSCLKTSERSFRLASTHYKSNKARWAELYISTTLNYATYLSSGGYIDMALEVAELSLEIDKFLLSEYLGQFTGLLVEFSSSFFKSESVENVIKIQKIMRTVFDGLKKVDAYSTISHPKSFINALNNISFYFSDIGDSKTALEVALYMKNIVEKYYRFNSSEWFEIYIVTLNNLAIAHSHNDDIDTSIEILEYLIDFMENASVDRLDFYKNYYFEYSNNLVYLYHSIGMIDKEISLLEKNYHKAILLHEPFSSEIIRIEEQLNAFR